MATIGDLIVNLRADIAQFRSDFQEASTRVTALRGDFQQLSTSVSENMGSVGSAIRGALGALGVSVSFGAIVEATRQSAEFAAAIYDQAKALGISSTALQEYEFAAKQAGVSTQQLETGFRQLARNVDLATSGGKSQGARVLESLGVDLKEANGQLRPLDQILEDVATKLAAMKDQTRATGDAMLVFGRGGTAILGMAREDLPALLKAAQDTGNVLDQQTVVAGKHLQDQMNALSGALRTNLYATLVELAPLLVKVTGYIADMANAWNRATHDFTVASDYSKLGPAQIAKVIADTTNELQYQQKRLADLKTQFHDAGSGIAAALMAGLGFGAPGRAGIAEQIGNTVDFIQQLKRNLAEAQAAQSLAAGGTATGIGVPAPTGVNPAERVIESLQAQVEEQKLLTAAIQQGTPAALENAKAQAEIVKVLEQARGATAEQRTEIVALATQLGNLKTAATESGEAQKRAAKEADEAVKANMDDLRKRLTEMNRVWNEIATPAQKYDEEIDKLKIDLAQGTIDQNQFNLAVNKAKETFSGVHDQATEFRDAMLAAGNAISSSFINAITSGQGLRSVMQGLLQDLAKIVLEYEIMIPLEDALKAGLSGIGGGSGGIFGFLGGLFGASGSPLDPGTGPVSAAASPVAVAASRVVGANLSGRAGAAGGSQVVNIHNYSGQPTSTRTRIGPNGERQLDVMIGQSVARNIRQGGDTATAMRSTFGAERTPIQR